MKRMNVIGILVILGAVTGCVTPGGSTVAEKRTYALDMAARTMDDLEAEKPGIKQRAEAAPGYAVFSNVESKIFMIASGNGYGVVHDNRTGKKTYMRMAEVGGGIGLGVKSLRMVFVFNEAEALDRFIEDGIQIGGDADAAATTGDDGIVAGADVTLDSVDVYQLTDSGLALSATISGTKYWVDSELN